MRITFYLFLSGFSLWLICNSSTISPFLNTFSVFFFCVYSLSTLCVPFNTYLLYCCRIYKRNYSTRFVILFQELNITNITENFFLGSNKWKLTSLKDVVETMILYAHLLVFFCYCFHTLERLIFEIKDDNYT